MHRIAAIAMILALAGTSATRAETPTFGDQHPSKAIVGAETQYEARVLPGTAFTYQGFLEDGGSPVTTAVDLRFTLYEDAAGTIVRGGPIVVLNVTPDEGVFSTSVDFGTGPFNAPEQLDYWMRVEVSPAGAGTYDDLGIQALDAAPFALNTRGIIVDNLLNVGIGGIFNNVSFLVRQRSAADFPFVVQNTDGSVQHIVVDPNGNVGVGTLFPSAQLHVDGSLRLQTGQEAAGRVLTSDAQGNADWTEFPPVEAGSYVPVLTSLQGFQLGGASFVEAEYSRVGQLVTVVVRFEFIDFALGTNRGTISLPPGLPASGLLVSGVVTDDHYRNGSSEAIGIVAHNNAATVLLKTNGVTNSGPATAYATFTYRTSAN